MMMLQSELFELLESTADPAFSIDEDGLIVSWNAAAEKLLGFTAREVLRRHCHEVLDARGRLGTPICMQDCPVQRCARQSGNVPNFDMEVRTTSGATVWVNVSTLSHRSPRDGRLTIAHIMRDISHLKRQETLLSTWIDLSRRIAAIAERGKPTDPSHPLSERELQILQLLAEPRSPAEVAKEIGITSSTLRNHLHRINEKLGTKDRLGAVLHAMHRGLI